MTRAAHNTFVVPTWLKRETIATLLDLAGSPPAIADRATDEEIEAIADALAQTFAEAGEDDA
jgi:hypothetical protein